MNFSACLRSAWIWLFPLLLLGACQINVFSPLKPVEDPGFGPNGQPRILSLTIPGIPPENIRIDQETRQITITVPTNYSAQTITPVLRMTPDTRFVEANDSRSTLWILDGSNPDWARMRIQTTNGEAKNAYQVVYVPAGPLQFGQFAVPFSLTVNPFGTLACLPVYNFVDGQRDGTLTLTHRQTGQQLTFRQQPSNWSDCARITSTDGAVIVSFIVNGQRPYALGDYTASFQKPNGRSATFNQPVTLVRGEPRFFITTEFAVGPVTTLDGIGANLFSTDQASLLVYKQESPVQTVPVALSITQDRVAAQARGVPMSRPGYYYTQLVVNGVKTANIQRMPVRANPNQVVIWSITPSASSENLLQINGPTVSLDAPIVLMRDRVYGINSGPQWGFLSGENWRVRYRFTSTTTSTDEFTILGTLQSVNMTIPATAKPGLYLLTAEGVTEGQPDRPGLTLDRVVQIQ